MGKKSKLQYKTQTHVMIIVDFPLTVIDDATTTTTDPIRLRVSNKYPVKVGYPTILKCEVDGRRPSSTENLLSIEGWIWNATQKGSTYMPNEIL